MSNIQVNEPLYYKSLRLKSENLLVEVKEKSPWSEGEITIYHSPRKWSDNNFMVHLKDAKALDEYIDMLQQFRNKYSEELKQLTQRKKDDVVGSDTK